MSSFPLKEKIDRHVHFIPFMNSHCSEESEGSTKGYAFSDNEITDYLSQKSSIEFEEAQQLIKELTDRFGLEAIKFLHLFNVSKLDRQKACKLIEPFKDIKVLEPLVLYDESSDEEEGIDVDVDYYRKEAEKYQNYIEELKEKLSVFNVIIPFKGSITEDFLNRYFKPEQHQIITEKLIYGSAELTVGPISNAFQKAVYAGNELDARILYNSICDKVQREEFMLACEAGLLRIIWIFWPHLDDLLLHVNTSRVPRLILANENIPESECTKMLQTLCQKGCQVTPLTFRAAVFNRRPNSVQYLLDNYSFGVKMLRRLARDAPTKSISKAINHFLYD